MKLFSDCRGPCSVCAAMDGGCLAGHGDDDFQLAPKERIEEVLKTGRYAGKPDGRILASYELEEVRRWLEKAK